MATNVDVKELKVAEDSLYSTQKVSISSSKSFLTPAKSLDIKKLPGIVFSDKIRGINELYKTFNSKRINNALTTHRSDALDSEVSNLKRKTNSENQVNICFVDYEENKIPNKEEMEFLTDFAHVHSDITPLPILSKYSKFVGIDTFEHYSKFIKDSIATIEQLNHKPLIGVVPMAIPKMLLPKLISLYSNSGINAFCFDFQGSTISSKLTTLRVIMRHLKNEKLMDNSFSYALNLGEGKSPKDKTVIPAKDIISFGYGINCLGNKHIRSKLSPEIRAKILASKHLFENSVRLFNKEDYGYYKTSDKVIIDSVYPKDSVIPLSHLETIKQHKGTDKIFNMEQQALEALKIRDVLNESEKPLVYLKKKKNIDVKDLRNMENLKKKKF